MTILSQMEEKIMKDSGSSCVNTIFVFSKWEKIMFVWLICYSGEAWQLFW